MKRTRRKPKRRKKWGWIILILVIGILLVHTGKRRAYHSPRKDDLTVVRRQATDAFYEEQIIQHRGVELLSYIAEVEILDFYSLHDYAAWLVRVQDLSFIFSSGGFFFIVVDLNEPDVPYETDAIWRTDPPELTVFEDSIRLDFYESIQPTGNVNAEETWILDEDGILFQTGGAGIRMNI